MQSKGFIASLRIKPTTFVLVYNLGYHYGISVLCCCIRWLKFRYSYRGLISDQIWRKRFFSKIVPVFRKYLSVSRWNLRGYFRIPFRFPQVNEFGKIDGKSSAIYLADSFCQHYSVLWSAWQEDPYDPQERCAMARTSCARLQEIILRANLLYVPNIKM